MCSHPSYNGVSRLRHLHSRPITAGLRFTPYMLQTSCSHHKGSNHSHYSHRNISTLSLKLVLGAGPKPILYSLSQMAWRRSMRCVATHVTFIFAKGSSALRTGDGGEEADCVNGSMNEWRPSKKHGHTSVAVRQRRPT